MKKEQIKEYKKQNNRNVGTLKEQLAKDYLETKGIKILECNYRVRQGEIDLIGLDQNVLVFFEVKYRKNDYAGNPLEAVNSKKQIQISKIALFYLNQQHLNSNNPIRFDVIGILGDEITWIKDAFYFVY